MRKRKKRRKQLPPVAKLILGILMGALIILSIATVYGIKKETVTFGYGIGHIAKYMFLVMRAEKLILIGR